MELPCSILLGMSPYLGHLRSLYMGLLVVNGHCSVFPRRIPSSSHQPGGWVGLTRVLPIDARHHMRGCHRLGISYGTVEESPGPDGGF